MEKERVQVEECKPSAALTKSIKLTKGRGFEGLDCCIIIPHGSRPGFLAWGTSMNMD